MARIAGTNAVFERRRNSRKPSHPAFVLSDFISSSTLNPKYPLKNYPYNIYSGDPTSAWATAAKHFQVGENNYNYENTLRRSRWTNKKFWWWQPDQESIPSEFLESSSMHGLKYVSQPKRHLIERLFWFLSFIACVIGATLMISDIWRRYYQNPVIVTFNPTEQDVDSIPFPAITICNINPFKRSRVERYAKRYKEATTEAEKNASLDALRVINAICSTQQSFLKMLNFAPRRGEMVDIPEAKGNPSEALEKKLTQFLLSNSQPCRELIRICVWAQEPISCDKLFKPIITDTGKCCTFNLLPQELMEQYRSPTSQTILGDDPNLQNISWTKEELDEWKKWNYAEGYIIGDDLKYPFRQRRAGNVDGLSIILDPDLEDSFCPSTDSMGIKILYHVPLDAPRVADLDLIVGVNREVYLEVNPDLTIADDGILSYSHMLENAILGRNTHSSFTNLIQGATAWRNAGVTFYLTIAVVSCTIHLVLILQAFAALILRLGSIRKFLGKLHKVCSYCKYSCNDLNYNAEVTFAQLQPYSELWANGVNVTREVWMDHQISIVHIFMGSDSTVPKLRQKLYQTVDLIANTGGLLGLSIGFSVLSAVEIVYFATLRICCRKARKSKRFGHVPCTPPTTENNNEENPPEHRNAPNRMGVLNNRNLIQEMNSRNQTNFNDRIGEEKWAY